jgi:hypothetical protein
MNDAPAAIPWYKSAVLRGILVAVVTQIIGKVQAKYHIDVTTFGLNINDLVGWLMDLISAAAAAYAFHGRLVKPLPDITLTKAAAVAVNTAPAAPGASK